MLSALHVLVHVCVLTRTKDFLVCFGTRPRAIEQKSWVGDGRCSAVLVFRTVCGCRILRVEIRLACPGGGYQPPAQIRQQQERKIELTGWSQYGKSRRSFGKLKIGLTEDVQNPFVGILPKGTGKV